MFCMFYIYTGLYIHAVSYRELRSPRFGLELEPVLVEMQRAIAPYKAGPAATNTAASPLVKLEDFRDREDVIQRVHHGGAHLATLSEPEVVAILDVKLQLHVLHPLSLFARSHFQGLF